MIQPIPNLGLSNAIRASLVGWSKSLANDLAAEGITVNMLLPGRIHTERVDELDEGRRQAHRQEPGGVARGRQGRDPGGALRHGAEFADTAAFLVSERASYITGSQIRVDGGAIRSV